MPSPAIPSLARSSCKPDDSQHEQDDQGEDQQAPDDHAAVTGALRKVGELVLKQHLQTCVRDAMRSDTDTDRDEKVAEIVTLFQKQAK